MRPYQTYRNQVDPPGKRYSRRLLTVSAYGLLMPCWLALMPLSLVVTAAADLVRGQRRLPHSRAVLFAAWYLVCECLGVVAAAVIFTTSPRRPNVAAYAVLQRIWTRWLMAGLQRTYGLRLQIDGTAAAASGPFILCVRHSSPADTILAANIVANPNRILLRYVLKTELLFDPCLDIVGGYLPNAFVRRDGSDRAAEIAAVTSLAYDLGSHDGVLIYPEGTRFTPSKHASIMGRLQASDPQRYARLQALTYTLPPKVGGISGLLAHSNCDVVFLVHAGFEQTANAKAILNGALIARDVAVKMWRVPRNEIPEAADARLAWLDDKWLMMDEWIQAQVAAYSDA